uniref:Endoplasmic reticulum-Golgi intermediate compartment protein 3 n=1 Tax=Schistocephalus solidus TaxID=70667 RepID=A0A0X3NWI7_SCHSO
MFLAWIQWTFRAISKLQLKKRLLKCQSVHQEIVFHRLLWTLVGSATLFIGFIDEATPNGTLAVKKGPDYCGSCYGAAADATTCCNSCDSVLEAYRLKGWVVPNVDSFEQCREERATGARENIGKQGCRLVGHMGVNKVAGSFHIAPGKSYGQGHIHVHDLQAVAGAQFNLSHHINKLTFGAAYPGHQNPLDGSKVIVELESPMVSYFLKLVPTLYLDSNKNMVTTHQYSATWQTKLTPLSGAQDGVPGVFFSYEISPLLVKLTEERKSFLHFLTNTCAIIGGVFTVASLLDAFIYRSLCLFEKMN